MIRIESSGKNHVWHHEQGQPKRNPRHKVMLHQTCRQGRRLNPSALASRCCQAQHPAARLGQGSEEEFWAQKEVSFEIRCGERVGINGRNDAGKSKLLKIHSRISKPSTGRNTSQ